MARRRHEGHEPGGRQAARRRQAPGAKTRGLAYQPEELANGANGLLDEVSASKITGEEDRYSHTDLSDFEANVSGSQTTFGLLAPALRQNDPALAARIAARFDAVQDELATLKKGGELSELRDRRPGRAAQAQPARRRPRRAAVPGGVQAPELMPRPVDRRRFLGLAGASVGGLAVGAGLERALDGGAPPPSRRPSCPSTACARRGSSPRPRIVSTSPPSISSRASDACRPSARCSWTGLARPST